MKPPPKIKKPALRDEQDRQAENRTTTYKSADIQLEWSVPSEERDGFDLYISQYGRIALKQNPQIADEVIILLHPDEAVALLKILPIAITTAKKFNTKLN